MKRKILVVVILIILNIFLALLVSIDVEADNLKDKMIDRAMMVNQKEVLYNPRLNATDVITYEQAYNRVDAIFYYAKKFNDMYDIHPRRVTKDMYAIIEMETRFVNYRSLDNGLSFGVPSIQIRTAEWVANKLDEDFNLYETQSNTRKQVRYAVYYYYYLLQHYNDRYKAILGYNVGHNLPDEQRWRNYFFNIIGRLHYYEQIWEE